MRCHDICENLSAYIDGMLEQSDASLVEQHLESCPGCKAEYDDLLATIELVRDLPEVELPPSFRDELKKRLIAAGSFESAPKPASRRLLGGRWVGMIAAAAVIFVTVGITALWYDAKGMVPFPGLGGKVAGESDLARKQLAGRANDVDDPVANMKALKADDNADELRITSSPGSEDSNFSAVQEDTEAPMALELQLPADIARDETGAMSDAAQPLQTRKVEEPQFSISAVPETKQNGESEPQQFITALTDEEKAARDAAPPGMGGGPSQAVVYSLTLKVDDMRQANELIGSAVLKHGGFIETQQGKSNKYLLVTVPFYNAQTLIEDIGQYGTITDRRSNQMDMSTAIQQLEKNISALQGHENYLAGQLQNQTNKVVEKELAKVREQITTLHTELAAVNTRVMMSKVELTLSDR